MDASLATHHHHRQRQHTPNTSRQKPKLAWMRKGIVLPGHFPYVPLRHPGAPLRRHYPTCRLLTHQQVSDPPESATHASSGHPRLSDSGETDNQDGRITPQTSDSAESDNQRRRANHTLISEPTTTSATPIQNGMPNATPNRSVLEAVENSGVAYEPIASVSILPCSMPYPQHA